jgi:serine/threonine-protein kinase
VVGDLFKTAPDPFIGRTLDGRYEVMGRLGEGGAGVVYRGRQAHLGRFVAIKVLHQDAAVIPEWRRRFEREARALSALAHPNVVPVTDFGIDNGLPFLVMELLQGKTLGELIKEGPLPLWRALDIFSQTLRGLAFAHSKGIVHRDMKPANVFLQELPDQADHVRLLDFGMVKFLEGSGSRTVPENLTRHGVMIGTPAYMSPEQVKGAPSDARTDVYAAGILLFELLAGKRPFNADSFEGYMGAHLTQPVPSLAKLRPKLARAALFQGVVERAMAKQPADRFKDAEAMLVAMENVVARLPASALSGGSAQGRRKSAPHALVAAPAGARLVRRAFTVTMFAAGIVGVGAVGYLRHERAPEIGTATSPAAPPRPTPAKPAAPPPKPAPPATAQKPAPPPPATESTKPAPAAEPPKSAVAQPPLKAAAPAAPAKAPEEQADDQGPPDKPEKAKPAKPRESEMPSQPRARARDPWKGAVPRALKPIRDRVDRGAHVSQKGLRPVYDFAHQNPGDPRPWLLLGHAYAQLDWFSDSVERYQRAYHVDTSSRGDPQMLADLLKAAAHPVAGRAAARAVHDMYGAEAIPAVEKALKAHASDKDASARLARLRETLPK